MSYNVILIVPSKSFHVPISFARMEFKTAVASLGWTELLGLTGYPRGGLSYTLHHAILLGITAHKVPL